MSETTQTVSVRCNHCGAPLQVGGAARFLTCSHCGSQLEVKHAGGAVYTEVLQAIDQRTERIERDVAHLKRQNAVEQLDREWDMRRQDLLVANKDGSRTVPSSVGGVVGGVVAVIFGIAWMSITAGIGAPAIFPLFGLLFIGAGLFGAISQVGKASAYEQEEADYRQRRAALLRQDEAAGPLR
ncbi:MAG TPA: hypothetical protein VER17_09595 [Tepidisphaeraceae bacterium]|nr:hypothetical protein [Tepidisphaeraceae bacterium]